MHYSKKNKNIILHSGSDTGLLLAYPTYPPLSVSVTGSNNQALEVKYDGSETIYCYEANVVV